MATDGVSLYYNPEFVDTLNSATLAGVLAHEVMHPALQHHVRRSGRDPRRWNEACDYAINPLLLDAGLSLPDGVLVDHRFRGMSAEQIYNLREGEAQPQSGGQNSASDGAGTGAGETPEPQGNSDEPIAPVTEGGIGQVLDAPLPDDGTPSVEEQAREWSVARQPGGHSLEASRQGSSGPRTNSRRRGGGSGRLARVAAQALVGHHPGRFELDAAESPPHLGRSLPARSRAGGRRRDSHRCRLLRLSQCPSVAPV
jgi:hypothetical protein